MQNRDFSPLEPVHNVKPYKHVEGLQHIERFFRTAGLEVDKEDIKRYYDFVENRVADLLLAAERAAKANDRIRVEPWDIPITNGLQQNIQAFQKLDVDIGLEPILARAVPEPQIDLGYSDETEARLPTIAGGLSLALARCFKIIDPQVKHPSPEQWERAFQIFDLLV